MPPTVSQPTDTHRPLAVPNVIEPPEATYLMPPDASVPAPDRADRILTALAHTVCEAGFTIGGHYLSVALQVALLVDQHGHDPRAALAAVLDGGHAEIPSLHLATASARAGLMVSAARAAAERSTP